MSDEIIGISLAPEVAQLIHENDVDLYSEISKRVPGLSRPSPDVNASLAARGSRSIELLILASAVAAPLVATAIGQIIESLTPRKVSVAEDDSPLPEETRRSLTFAFLGLKVEFVEERKR